jgi:hypothetical protein
MGKVAFLFVSLLGIACAARADANGELNKILEDNAVSAAYARMCDEEPMAEELKANTMMLLAVNGIQPHNVQLGSAKWREIMRREFAGTKNAESVNCASRISEAKARLGETQKIIAAGRRP